jgi:hypothetical protein
MEAVHGGMGSAAAAKSSGTNEPAAISLTLPKDPTVKPMTRFSPLRYSRSTSCASAAAAAKEYV